jgi:hypothetical protein
MNFDDSPGDAAFRAEARAWIQANAPTHLQDALRRSGFASVNIPEKELIPFSRAWHADALPRDAHRGRHG